MDISDAILHDYFELLRFETVGANPLQLRACLMCATWIQQWLKPLAFKTELLQAPGLLGAPPILFATRPGTEGAPTVLIYGHYDVQPPDPLEEWNTPPFEPTLLPTGRVAARGAQDDKGQWFALLCGMRTFLQTHSSSALPTIKILLEGQEESGSTALARLAPTLREKLAATVLLVCDTCAAADLRPAIVAGLRGVSHFTVRLEGPSHDLHSGEFGGIAPNPAQGLVRLLSTLHHPDGSIAVSDFLNGIEPPSAEEKRLAEASALTSEQYAHEIGCPPVGGEEGLSLTERNSFRPTLELNGIHSGYGGPGSKTIIPACALAKLSMRLVPGQNPNLALEAVVNHLKAHTPRGFKLTIEDVTGQAPGFRLPLTSPIFRLAQDVLSHMDARGSVFQWDGASIPIVSTLREVSGAAPLLVGWGQPHDHIHSPNESFGLDQFARAMEWGEKILDALASLG